MMGFNVPEGIIDDTLLMCNRNNLNDAAKLEHMKVQRYRELILCQETIIQLHTYAKYVRTKQVVKRILHHTNDLDDEELEKYDYEPASVAECFSSNEQEQTNCRANPWM